MKNFRRRPLQLGIVFLVLFAILTVALGDLTLIQGNAMATTGQESLTRTLSVTGKRGTIYDANGIPLAYDESSYSIQISRDPTKVGENWRAVYTEAIIKTIEIIQSNSGKLANSFSIKKDENGLMYFDFNTTDEDVFAARESMFRTNFYLDEDDTPRTIYNILRARYMIPEELSFEEASAVLAIWEQIQNYAYISYVPVTIATDVDIATVSEIEALGDELLDISAVETTTRVYPKGETAAHIVGYMGQTYDEDTLQWMDENGYLQSDQIGVYGVESTMEEYLSSNIGTRRGERVVQVDSNSNIIQEISYTAPTDGDDVYLTIDYNLQVVVERALAENVKEIYEKQQELYQNNLESYQKKEQERGGTKTSFATMGAAIVMDMNGNVLSLASYPSFDPNMFIGGISEEDYAQLRDNDAAPLFNKAISSAVAPGSTFKMVTAFAALNETNEDGTPIFPTGRTISCQREYNIGIEEGYKGPNCWTTNPASHANQDIVAGLKNSCNYFFYTLAGEIGIDKLNKWADAFGLTSKTNIELTGEITSFVANQEALFNYQNDVNTGQKTYKPYLVKEQIKTQLEAFGAEREEVYTEEQLEKTATRIVQLVGSVDNDRIPSGIRQILREELGIAESVSYNRGWDTAINQSLYEIKWNSTQTVLTGIGQSVSSITPIALLRYIVAIANHGTVYDATIIDKVVDANANIVMEQEPSIFGTISDPENNFDKIIEGMREVVSPEDGGTAATIFRDFKYRDQIAGKTGTAQVSTIDIENTAWFVAFAPLDNPQIAVVVYIPNGYSGSWATSAAKDILEYYLDQQSQQTTPESPNDAGALLE